MMMKLLVHVFGVYSFLMQLSSINSSQQWDRLIPMINKNLREFYNADHVFFSHVYKTGGNELLNQSVLPLSTAYDISLMLSNDQKNIIQECRKPNKVSVNCKIIQKCDNPKWLYGHNVKYEIHWHDQLLKSDNYRYVIMSRDPIMRLISLYFYSSFMKFDIPKDFYNFAKRHQHHGTADFLPKSSDLNEWMEILANNYLILINEEFDTSVSMMEAALGYPISNSTMSHKNNAVEHSRESLMIDYGEISLARQLRGIKAQYVVHNRLLAFFEIQKRILLE